MNVLLLLLRDPMVVCIATVTLLSGFAYCLAMLLRRFPPVASCLLCSALLVFLVAPITGWTCHLTGFQFRIPVNELARHVHRQHEHPQHEHPQQEYGKQKYRQQDLGQQDLGQQDLGQQGIGQKPLIREHIAAGSGRVLSAEVSASNQAIEASETWSQFDEQQLLEFYAWLLATRGDSAAETAETADRVAGGSVAAELAPMNQTRGSVDSSQTGLENRRASGLFNHRWLLAVWLVGSLIQSAALLVSMIRVRRIVAGARGGALRGKLQRAIGLASESGPLKRMPRVQVSRSVASPVVIGCWRPVVLVPRLLVNRLSVPQLSHVLQHEFEHVRQRDNWILLGQRLARVGWWWHPLVYLVGSQLESAREEICDDAVARRDSAMAYSETLLAAGKLMHKATQPALASGFAGTRHHLEQRIRTLLNPRRSNMKNLSLSHYLLLATLFAASSICLGASRLDAQEPDQPDQPDQRELQERREREEHEREEQVLEEQERSARHRDARERALQEHEREASEQALRVHEQAIRVAEERARVARERARQAKQHARQEMERVRRIQNQLEERAREQFPDHPHDRVREEGDREHPHPGQLEHAEQALQHLRQAQEHLHHADMHEFAERTHELLGDVERLIHERANRRDHGPDGPLDARGRFQPEMLRELHQNLREAVESHRIDGQAFEEALRDYVERHGDLARGPDRPRITDRDPQRPHEVQPEVMGAIQELRDMVRELRSEMDQLRSRRPAETDRRPTETDRRRQARPRQDRARQDRPERDRPERDRPERDRPERDRPEQADQDDAGSPERDRRPRERPPERDAPQDRDQRSDSEVPSESS